MQSGFCNQSFSHGARIAWKARRIVPLVGEKSARGASLRAPVVSFHNHWLVAENGRIIDILKKPPPYCEKHDLGDVVLLPPVVNAHTHLQLSWLGDKTLWRAGFAPWLKSLLPLLLPATRHDFGNSIQLTALETACASLASAGTGIVGDVGGSLTGAITAVSVALARHGVNPVLFCEWFGFADSEGYWPPRCCAEIAAHPEFAISCAPAGHGLYSTSAQSLQIAHAWCVSHKRVFSFHLAESQEETELLCAGTGPLAQLYAGTVLPQNWQPPGLRPFVYGRQLGLLGPGTLVVHAVQLNTVEIMELADTGTAICLCPRSNYNLGVGEAHVQEFIERDILLCLGTDGLTSNTDMDVRNEALWLRRRFDLPWCALWRMATANGYAALGVPFTGLVPGSPACFSIWPEADDV